MRNGRLILIADNDSDKSVQVAMMLGAQGQSVHTIAGGRKTLTYIDAHVPALVLVGMQLADMSGFELCRRLKSAETTRHIPLLCITTSTAEEETCLRLGASDFIREPLRRAEVLARVDTQLELALLREGAHRPPARLPAPTPAAPEAVGDDGWISLAMEVGRIFAFQWDCGTDLVVRSTGCARILGNGSESTRDLGANFFQMVHPDDREQLRGIVSILSPAYDMYDTQYRLCRADGKVLTLRECSRGFFDSNGKLTRVIGTVADITEQVAAQCDLEQTQTDLTQLIERVPIPVALANSLGRIEYINNQFARSFGYRLEEIAAPEAWWEHAYPDESYRREVIETWTKSVETAARLGDDIPPKEYRITDKDGGVHLVDVFGAVLGNRKLILFDDTTDRKRAEGALRESEERFRVMADTAPVMLWISGTDKLCTFFNKRWLDFTGRSMEQELGNGWAEGVHRDDLDRCLEIYTSAFDKHEDFQMEYRIRRFDGEYRWVLDRGTPRFTADGTFAGFTGSAIDITELKREKEQILAAQKLESLGVLAGGVAHDFNNFLGCILADADATMSELATDSPVRDGLERIETVAVRASQIVRQIISYTGDEQRDLEPVDISYLIKEMLQLLNVFIPKNASLNVDLPESLWLTHANAAQLRQVVMNVVLNAGEAIGDQSGVISITGKRRTMSENGKLAAPGVSSDSDYVCVEISDTGAGMTEEVRKRIFDPCFSTKFPGRGLGLAAVQNIVHGHRGKIDVTSTPGTGTSFQILIPCNAKPPVSSLASEPASARISPHRGSILIVEDEETLRVSVATMLRRTGFSVLEAADGDLAVNLIRHDKEDIALVLLDLTLPGKSSHEVFEELQRWRPGVKVILTSAYGRETVAGPLKALQRESFIRKPYHLSKLVTAVRDALPPD
jgi:PAS domain S-box-containing protein